MNLFLKPILPTAASLVFSLLQNIKKIFTEILCRPNILGFTQLLAFHYDC